MMFSGATSRNPLSTIAKCCVAVAVICSLHGIAVADFRDEVLVDEPFLYYEFNETSGFTAADSSGNGNDGEYIDGVTLGAAGPAGTAIILDGDSGFVETPPTGVLTEIWSMEFIIRVDGLSDACCTSMFSTVDFAIVPDNGLGEGGALHFNLEDDGNFIVIDAPNTGATEEDFEYPVGTGEFAHVVAVSDNADTLTRTLYINGEIAIEDFELAGDGPTSFDGVGNIGAWDPEGRFLGGVLDEFAIYDRILSEDDVLRHFAASPLSPAVTLTVNQDDGSMVLTNVAGEEFSIADYAITSGVGALDAANWDSIDGRDSAGDGSVDPDNDWTVTEASAFELAENAGAGNSLTLAADSAVALGDGVWRPFHDREVGIAGTDGAGEAFFGIVTYEGDDILFADFDLDGDVDTVDWDTFVTGYGSDLEDLSPFDAYFLADLDGDGEHTPDDFIEFVEAFDGFNGEGAFAATIAAGVPEPGTWLMLLIAVAAVILLRNGKGIARCLMPALVVVSTIAIANNASAELLAEYTFENGFQDTSGNNRTGQPVGLLGFGEPIVQGGRADFSGDPLAWIEVPLGAANPFDGTNDFTIEMTLNSFGADSGAGVILLGSSPVITSEDQSDSHSMAVFVEPHEEEDGDVFGGSLVYDNWFVGEVRVDDALLLDGEDHSILITYSAPADLGNPEDPEPGEMFINIDGDWLARDEIAPNIPDIGDHLVTLGSTNNELFPFECEEGECFTQEFIGTMDNVRIYDDAQPPSLLRAEVDRETGDIQLLGGEFTQDVQFYEIRSEAGSLNSDDWQETNLDALNVDQFGEELGESWDTLAASTGRLAEGFLLESSFFDGDRQESLGTGYDFTVDAMDLEIEIVNADNERIGLSVEYINEPPVVIGLDGDLDDDGLVGQGDLDLVLLNWGGAFDTLPPEWLNERPTEGIVGQESLDVVLLNWGSQAAALNAASVPEPASAVIVLACALFTIVVGPRAGRRK